MDASLVRSTIITAILTLALLLVPLVAMQVTQDVRWGSGDFLAAGSLIFAARMGYVLAARRVQQPSRRLLCAFVISTGLVLVWAELAVGLFD